jgi:hypothetical protein
MLSVEHIQQCVCVIRSTTGDAHAVRVMRCSNRAQSDDDRGSLPARMKTKLPLRMLHVDMRESAAAKAALSAIATSIDSNRAEGAAYSAAF